MGIIYKATNRVNGKVYVGKTMYDVPRRLRAHKRGEFYFGRAIKKYGIRNFDIVVVDYADNPELLSLKEQDWIVRCRSFVPNGYNLTEGGEGVLGLRFSSESIERLSKSHLGQNPWNKGKQFSLESRRRMSESHKGQKPWCTGTKGVLKAWNKGLQGALPPRPQEVRDKISNGLKKAYRSGTRAEGMRGRRWINCNGIERILAANAALPDGWNYGRPSVKIVHSGHLWK